MVILMNMRKIMTKVKNSRRINVIAYPENILIFDYLKMGRLEVRSILVRVILAERKSCRVNNNKKLMPYVFRLRKRRIELARYYVSIAGKVSPLLFRPRLPVEIKWPGIIGLVETRPYESSLIITL